MAKSGVRDGFETRNHRGNVGKGGRADADCRVDQRVQELRDDVKLDDIVTQGIRRTRWHVSNLQVLVTQVCMTSILSQTADLVSVW